MLRTKDTLAGMAGLLGLTWGRDLTDQMERLSHEEGVRWGRRDSTTTDGGPETFGDAFEAAFGDSSFGRANRFLAKVGALAGFGYGVWLAFAGSAGAGAAVAVTVLKWAAIGALGGALFLMLATAAACIAMLFGILWALGLLLNFLTNL